MKTLDSKLGGYPRSAFERIARIEENHAWFSHRADLLIWAMNRFFPESSSFLEVGCGTGLLLKAIKLSRPELQVWGGDMHEEGLCFAREKLPDVQFFNLDAREELPLDEVDVIGSFDVLEHIEQDELVLGNFRSKVSSAGGIIITVPNHPWLWGEIDVYSGHVRRYTASELTRKVESAGFQVVFRSAFVSTLLPLVAISRMKQRVFGLKDPYGELEINPLVNEVLKKLCYPERLFIEAGNSLPIGSSLLLVAKPV